MAPARKRYPCSFGCKNDDNSPKTFDRVPLLEEHDRDYHTDLKWLYDCQQIAKATGRPSICSNKYLTWARFSDHAKSHGDQIKAASRLGKENHRMQFRAIVDDQTFEDFKDNAKRNKYLRRRHMQLCGPNLPCGGPDWGQLANPDMWSTEALEARNQAIADARVKCEAGTKPKKNIFRKYFTCKC